MTKWGFYGRRDELESLNGVFDRGRWFFLRVTGRRRIGKTTLVQRSLPADRRAFYVQIPDSAPAGVLSSVHDALETFQISASDFERPRTLREIAQLVESLARAGFIVVIDEFQYFNRDRLSEFPSALQEVVDRLTGEAANVPGGLVVLGSIQTDIDALLRKRDAPLYNRTTDEMDLRHLDIASVAEIISVHSKLTPERLLFLWNLFEGVPKFYRDCYEQNVLGATRTELLRRIFFESSSPLRTEADNWFLKELRGRYDVVLKFVARQPGTSNAEIKAHVVSVSSETDEQVGGYIKVLSDRYRMIERKLPIFAKPTARRGRFYISDNFLRAWLAALQSPISALNFRPVEDLVAEADRRLQTAEGFGLEKLVGQLYEERSRKGLSGFPLTRRVEGYWDRGETEIDLVAVNDSDQVIRFGSCKRNASELLSGAQKHDGHVDRFLKSFKEYRSWTIEKVAIAPTIPNDIRSSLDSRGYIAQDLDELLDGLL